MEVVTMSIAARMFAISEFARPSDGEPIRSVVLETEGPQSLFGMFDPGQEIAAHVHPHGQDLLDCSFWFCRLLSKEAVWSLSSRPEKLPYAKPGQVHGAMNTDSNGQCRSFSFPSWLQAMLALPAENDCAGRETSHVDRLCARLDAGCRILNCNAKP
jgi:hypothetical protein